MVRSPSLEIRHALHAEADPLPSLDAPLLSVRIIESLDENNDGGALRRLNAITGQLESLDFENTPGHVLNGLKREELVALDSTLLHELYFASMGGDGQPTKG